MPAVEAITVVAVLTPLAAIIGRMVMIAVPCRDVPRAYRPGTD